MSHTMILVQYIISFFSNPNAGLVKENSLKHIKNYRKPKISLRQNTK